MSRSRYLGQCDVLRREEANEKLWVRMMEGAKPISWEAFLRNVDITPLLDVDETAIGFLRDAAVADPAMGTFRSVWGDRRCWFLHTAGFEFIFVEGDRA